MSRVNNIFKIFIASLFLMIGLSSQAQGNLKFSRLTTEDGLPQTAIYSIAKDKYGFMWFGTWGGACRYDGYSFKVFRANEDNPTALPDNRINSIFTDAAQNIWIYTGDAKHLNLYSYETETFTRHRLNHLSADLRKAFLHSRSKAILYAQNEDYRWEASSDGLKQVNKKTLQQKITQVNKYNPFSISDNVINTIYLDKSDNLWIGTRNGGVNYTNLKQNHFAYWFADENGKGLAGHSVRAVSQDNAGRLWIGFEDEGITLLERDLNGVTYKHLGKDKLISPSVRSIYCDRLGFVWIGTKGGLDRFDPHTGTFRHYYAGTDGSIPHKWVTAIMEDYQGVLWIGTFNGIARYDRQQDRFISLDPQKTIGSRQVKAIMEDHRHNLWVATENGGVTRLRRQGESLIPTRFTHQTGNKNTLINNRIFALAEDKTGMMWLGTNAGLSRFNPNDNSFRHFNMQSGLPDDIIMGILPDDKGHLWISHKKGLTRMDIRTFAIRNFNTHDGIQGNEFNQNAIYKNRHTGEMFFGGTNGLNSFFPDRISENRDKPRVVLTDLSVLNQPVTPGKESNGRIILETSLLCTKEIELTWQDKTFSLKFSALDYANAQGNQYRYKLEGFDKQWMVTNAAMRMATYSNLPAGSYTFKVFAANSDGVWSDTPASVMIRVLPPWWFSWWAKVFYALLCVLIIWLIYRFIVIRIEFRKNEELNRQKLKFFTEVSHEFRTPLTLIIDPLEQLINGNAEKEKAQKYYTLMHRNARQLLTLINQLLDFRKLEAGHLTLHLEKADLVALVRSVAASFEERAQEKKVVFTVKTAIEQLETAFDSDKLTMVLNNLLSNAFKFTPESGEVCISLSLSDDEQTALIKVSDSGIGMSGDTLEKIFDLFYQSENPVIQKQGTGIGLALTKELVELHHGQIGVKSELGKGACFTVSLPVSEAVAALVQENEPETSITEEDIPANNYDAVQTMSSSSPILLLVEDNPDIRKYIELNFKDNYTIQTAENGADGFRLATESIPDIIISDIMMPGTDGLTLCRMLKTDERTSHIPVILLTARQSDESKAEGYETGADAYVTKPFSTLVLKAQVRSLLEQRQRLRALFSRGTYLEMKKIAINITDEAFLNKVLRIIDDNITEEVLDVDMLAEKVKMSSSQLYRKIKSLTDQTIHNFITTRRMNKALEYLLSGEYTVSETAYKVGYSIPSNFSRTFAKQFGDTPVKYLEKLKNPG